MEKIIIDLQQNLDKYKIQTTHHDFENINTYILIEMKIVELNNYLEQLYTNAILHKKN